MKVDMNSKNPGKYQGFSSRGSRNRTHIDGFGDRCSTVELCPYFCGSQDHRRLLYLKHSYLSTAFAVDFLLINLGRKSVLLIDT